MEFRIRNETAEPEPILDIWLEQRNDGVIVIKIQPTRGLGFHTPWSLISIIPNEGVRLCHNVPKDFGFPLDKNGRIKIVE